MFSIGNSVLTDISSFRGLLQFHRFLFVVLMLVCSAFLFFGFASVHGRSQPGAGRWNIRRLKGQADLKKLVGSDPFHSFLDQSTLKIVLRIFAAASVSPCVFLFVFERG